MASMRTQVIVPTKSRTKRRSQFLTGLEIEDRNFVPHREVNELVGLARKDNFLSLIGTTSKCPLLAPDNLNTQFIATKYFHNANLDSPHPKQPRFWSGIFECYENPVERIWVEVRMEPTIEAGLTVRER